MMNTYLMGNLHISINHDYTQIGEQSLIQFRNLYTYLKLSHYSISNSTFLQINISSFKTLAQLTVGAPVLTSCNIRFVDKCQFSKNTPYLSRLN